MKQKLYRHMRALKFISLVLVAFGGIVITALFSHRLRAVKRHHIARMVGMVVAFALFAPFYTAITKPVFAQGLVERIVEILKEKAGFEYSKEYNFAFSKETPNYTAYAGDAATGGGHRIMIAVGASAVDFSFVTANSSNPQATPSALAAFPFTEPERRILMSAKDILAKAMDESGQASNSGSIINESRITKEHRIVLSTALELVERSATASGSLVKPPASTNLSDLIRQEDKDFVLFVMLSSLEIQTLAKNIDIKLDDLSKEVSQIVSKAALVEEPNERVVSFSSVQPDLDFLYRLNPGGITQEMIIKSQSYANNQFIFHLGTEALTYRDVGKSVWYLSDKIGDVIRFPKGYAKDANGAFTNNVDILIDRKEGQDYLQITVDPTWLRDASRVYPVTITNGIEVIPELREEMPGSNDRRKQRLIKSKEASASPTVHPTNTPVPTVSVSPTTAPAATASPTDLPSTPIPTSVSASPSATLAPILPTATPEATQSALSQKNLLTYIPENIFRALVGQYRPSF